MDDERWNLPLPLRLDPENPEYEELVRRSEAQQKKWGAKIASPFASKTPQDVERGMAGIKIKAKLEALQGLPEDSDLRPRIQAQLAESYAVTGRFDLAANIDPRPSHRAEWLSLWNAVTREGNERCKCADAPRPKGTHPVFQEKSVWSIRLGRDVYLLRCNQCGFRYTAEQKPAHLVEQEKERAKNAQANAK